MKPAELARELDVTATHLHQLCRRLRLRRKHEGKRGAARSTYSFPPKTVAVLRIEVQKRKRGGRKP